MYARPHANGARRYLCVKEPGKAGCGTITILAAPADDEVAGRVLAALDTPQFLAALIAAATGGTDAGDIAGQLRSIDARRDELAAMWSAGEISRKEWLTARDQLTAAADTLTAELSRTQHGRALASFAALEGTARDRWEQMPAGARRALIQSVTLDSRIRR